MRILAVIALLALQLWSASVPARELIVHKGLPQTELSQNQARLFFTMRLKLWPDGTAVKVFVLPDDTPLHRSFAKQVLGLYPYQLRRVWDRQTFSGTGQAPITVSTEAEMIKSVASTSGAIGYVGSGSDLTGVRLLEVR